MRDLERVPIGVGDERPVADGRPVIARPQTQPPLRARRGGEPVDLCSTRTADAEVLDPFAIPADPGERGPWPVGVLATRSVSMSMGPRIFLYVLIAFSISEGETFFPPR